MELIVEHLGNSKYKYQLLTHIIFLKTFYGAQKLSVNQNKNILIPLGPSMFIDVGSNVLWKPEAHIFSKIYSFNTTIVNYQNLYRLQRLFQTVKYRMTNLLWLSTFRYDLCGLITDCQNDKKNTNLLIKNSFAD